MKIYDKSLIKMQYDKNYFSLKLCEHRNQEYE